MKINARRVIALFAVGAVMAIRGLRGDNSIDIFFFLQAAATVLLTELIGEFISLRKKIRAWQDEQLLSEVYDELKISLKYIQGVGLAFFIVSLTLVVLTDLQ